ncbi:MAG TPA: hypothetical protein VGZ02_08365 [Candidatus Baltobacteraceae bacterium]|jgi:hypothetical protein|nr:hypothetical protein [Candidatus Baltobacteraceae bacterium]
MLYGWISLAVIVAVTIALAFVGRRPSIEEIEDRILADYSRRP